MNSFCAHCHFPLTAQGLPGSLCGTGCLLASRLSSPDKRASFIFRLILELVFFIVVLLISYSPSASSFIPEPMRFWIVMGLVTAMFFIMGPSFFRLDFSIRGKAGLSVLWLLFPFIIDYAASFYLILSGRTYRFEGYRPFVISSFMLIIYFLLSFLEALCHKKAYEDILWLLSLKPKRARLINKSQELDVEASGLKKGDTVRVLSGEVIPCDGVVVSGTTSVDESLFTCETTILVKKNGDFVRGGGPSTGIRQSWSRSGPNPRTISYRRS